MHVIERNCPNCSRLLRLRGPLRDVQEFACPDCGTRLLARTMDGDTQIVRKDRPAAKRVGSPSTNLPKIAAFTTAGLLLVALAAYLLSGPGSGESRLTRDPQPKGKEDPVVVVAQPKPPESELVSEPPELPDGPVAPIVADAVPIDVPIADGGEPTIDAPPPSEPVAMEVGTEDKDVVIPAAPVEPEVDPEIAKAEAAKVAAIVRINKRLELPIVSYTSNPQMKLDDLLLEMTEMLGTEFRSPVSDSERNTFINIKLQDCTAADVLSAALDKAGLRFEVRPDGIHTLSK